MLGAFLDSLYRLRDSSRVIIALSADHGVSSIPGIPSRYDGNTNSGVVRAFWDSTRAVRARLQRAGVDSTAFLLDTPYLILDRAKFAGTSVNADSVARDFIRAVKADPGVLRADLMRDIRRADPERDKIARRWQHMIPESLPVDVVVTLRPFWGWSGGYVEHGLPHDHDTNVPVVFYGAPFKPGRYLTFTRTVDVAPTLARVLGVTPLEKLDGRVLPEALR
jgi:arylsulfatase A-like enzyme